MKIACHIPVELDANFTRARDLNLIEITLPLLSPFLYLSFSFIDGDSVRALKQRGRHNLMATN